MNLFRGPTTLVLTLAGLLTAGMMLPVAVVGVWFMTWYQVAPRVGARLQTGIAAIDARDSVAAREIAEQLLQLRVLPPGQSGAPALLYGASILIDAEESTPAARRRLAKAAAYYLRQAEVRGWPEGSSGRGPYLLGRAYLEGRELDAARRFLLAALGDDEFRARALGQLVRLELATPEPDLPAATKWNEELLAQADLAESTKRRALGRRVDLLLHQRLVDEARAALDALVAEGDPKEADLHRWRGWSSLLQAEAATPPGERLGDALPALAAAVAAGGDRIAEAELLYARAALLAGDEPTARRMWDRVVTSDPAAPEAIAVALAVADADLANGYIAEAVAGYVAALEQSPAVELYENVWLPLSEFRERIDQAYEGLLARDEFDAAVEVATAANKMTSDLVVAQWISEAYRRKTLEPESTREEILDAWRRAGQAMLRAAQLRYASHGYPDDLWRAAEYFHQGEDPQNEAGVLVAYLNEEKYRRRPLALVRLAAAEMARGRADVALGHCQECIQDYADSIEVYAARLIAAQVHARQDENDQAIALLNDNFADDALRPESLEWRQGLFLLGKLHHRRGMRLLKAASRLDHQIQPQEYLQAAEAAADEFQIGVFKLEEAIVRYPHDEGSLEARWLAADGRRRSNVAARARLETTTIQDTRKALIGRIRRELVASSALLSELIERLEAQRSAGTLTPERDQLLRNSYFARGGVNFELEDYAAAAQNFDEAAGRYLNHPEALDAFVNWAACFHQLGRREEAIGVLEQAKAVLARLPEDADFSQTTNLARGQWEEHLERLQSALRP